MKNFKRFFVAVLSLVLMLVALNPLAASAQDDKLTIVWYPNESGSDLAEARDAIGAFITEKTGKEVEHLTTTDYNIAIEAIASGQGNLAFMGATGYVQAHELNDKVVPLVVVSGESGTLEDAVYYSWIGVKEENAGNYKDGDTYKIDNIKGGSFSFVSQSSTSGFTVPTTGIIDYFKDEELTKDDFLEGGEDKFFSEVLFGQSHQGSLFNVIDGRAAAGAFCDTCVFNYVEAVDGEFNEVGTTYAIREDAEEPFTNNAGDKFVVISVTPVLNSPFAINTEVTSEEDAKILKEAFTSDEILENKKIFISEEDKEKGVTGLFYRKGDLRFVEADDEWFNPIRDMQ